MTKVGHGYSLTTRTFHTVGTIHSNIGQGHRAIVPNFAQNTLLSGGILVNCLENERTVSIAVEFAEHMGQPPWQQPPVMVAGRTSHTCELLTFVLVPLAINNEQGDNDE